MCVYLTFRILSAYWLPQSNLEKWYAERQQASALSLSISEGEYRDRAKERRERQHVSDFEVQRIHSESLKQQNDHYYRHKRMKIAERKNMIEFTNKQIAAVRDRECGTLDSVDSEPQRPNTLQKSVGAQMLKSMGWSEGSGLGANCQGPAEAITVCDWASCSGGSACGCESYSRRFVDFFFVLCFLMKYYTCSQVHRRAERAGLGVQTFSEIDGKHRIDPGDSYKEALLKTSRARLEHMMKKR